MYKLIFIIYIFLTSNILAQKRRGPPEGITAGIGAIYVSSLYKGQEYRFRPIPSFSINYGRFSMFGPRLAYRVLGDQRRSFSLIARPDFFGGYDAEDSPALSGMDSRNGTANVGAAFNFNINSITLLGSYTKDILGVHGGSSTSLSLRTGLPINVFFKSLPFTFIGLGVGARYHSESFVNYYYGVKESEATASRPAYISSSALNYFISFVTRVKVSNDWMFMATFDREYLNDKISGSPIVDKESVYRIFSTFSYSF